MSSVLLMSRASADARFCESWDSSSAARLRKLERSLAGDQVSPVSYFPACVDELQKARMLQGSEREGKTERRLRGEQGPSTSG